MRHFNPQLTDRSRPRWLIGICSVLLTACQTAQTVEQLDRASGVTWQAIKEPAAYARTDARYSRAARDYVFVGPVEINTRGFREYFLWVGTGTTLDRGFVAPEIGFPERLIVEIAGEPIVLDLSVWSDLMPASSQIEPYDPSVKPTYAFGARVTRDFLARLSTAHPETILLESEAMPTITFFAWKPMTDWSGFSGSVASR
jgi:hypothetical protein